MKKRILNTAWILYTEGGIDAISMRNIAAELDLSATAIYRHFKDKHDLLTEMAIESYDLLFSKLTQVLNSVSAEERLIEMSRAWFEFSSQEREAYKLMFHTEIGNLSRNRSSRLLQSARGLNNFLKDRIFEYMLSHKIQEIKPEVVTFEFISLIKGMIENNKNSLFISEEEEFSLLFNKAIHRFLENLE